MIRNVSVTRHLVASIVIAMNDFVNSRLLSLSVPHQFSNDTFLDYLNNNPINFKTGA